MSPVDKGHDTGLNAAVAAVLRGEKHAQRLTNQQIADRAEIPVVSVQRYLDAKRGINMPLLLALANAVGLTPGQVIDAAVERLNRPNPTLVDDARQGIEEAVQAATARSGRGGATRQRRKEA